MPDRADAQSLWKDFLASGHAPEDAVDRYYGEFSVGDTLESRNTGAHLIVSGRKTATSSLVSDYSSSQPPPKAGDYSIVMDGAGKAVCVVETIRAWHAPFSTADESFARAYGEWDLSLETWKLRCGAYYARESANKKLAWSKETEMVFELFKVVFPAHRGPR